jgi:protein tyrosine/serine phosphatase
VRFLLRSHNPKPATADASDAFARTSTIVHIDAIEVSGGAVTVDGVSVEVSPGGERTLALDGCFNFRDAGGYPTADGFHVRWRRLFRAGGPHALTDNDVDALARLDIATIIDLRTVDEADERGRFAPRVAARTTHHLPMMDVLPLESELESWADATFVGDRYYGMFLEAAPMVADAIAVLSDPSAYPVLVHCSAGKDRTGILVAVVLGLLRVSDDDIVDDYALSGAAMRAMLEWLQGSSAEARERVRHYAPAILAAEPAAMRLFLARLRADYGSFDGYAEALGVGDAVAYVRGALVA